MCWGLHHYWLRGLLNPPGYFLIGQQVRIPLDDIKAKANGLILCIKQDALAAAKGELDSMQVKMVLQAMMSVIVDTWKEMRRASKQ